MTCFDADLQALARQDARSKQLKKQLQSLREREKEVASQVQILKTVFEKELADVEKLEGGSLANYFYKVVGKLDGMLTVERAQAYEAQVKYDAQEKQLQYLRKAIASAQEELVGLWGSEGKFQQFYVKTLDTVRTSGTPNGERILELERQDTVLENQLQEVREALTAGDRALYWARSASDSLHHAENWGTIDLFGGGLVANVSKHSHLDEAQEAVNLMQKALHRYKTELADISIAEMESVNVDGFARFADYFYDGFFADWMVQNKIDRSLNNMNEVRFSIASTQTQLRKLEQQLLEEQEQLRKQIEAIVIHG